MGLPQAFVLCKLKQKPGISLSATFKKKPQQATETKYCPPILSPSHPGTHGSTHQFPANQERA